MKSLRENGQRRKSVQGNRGKSIERITRPKGKNRVQKRFQASFEAAGRGYHTDKERSTRALKAKVCYVANFLSHPPPKIILGHPRHDVSRTGVFLKWVTNPCGVKFAARPQGPTGRGSCLCIQKRLHFHRRESLARDAGKQQEKEAATKEAQAGG